MNNIVFAIPTWNRKEQLGITLNQIKTQIKQRTDGRNYQIIISNNDSDDGTDETIAEFMAQSPDITITHSRLEPNQGFQGNLKHLSNLCLDTLSGELDKIWFFGDDDDLIENALSVLCSIDESGEFDIISAGNKLNEPHTSTTLSGTLLDVANKIGFLPAFGFITSLVISRRMLSDIMNQDLFSLLRDDAYVHASSLLYINNQAKTIYVDCPMVTSRWYPGQNVEQAKRWTGGDTYVKLFNFIDTLTLVRDSSPSKINFSLRFFRYFDVYFWDFLLNTAINLVLQDKKYLDHKLWGQLDRLADLISDPEAKKNLRIKTSLINMLLIKGNILNDEKLSAYLRAIANNLLWQGTFPKQMLPKNAF